MILCNAERQGMTHGNKPPLSRPSLSASQALSEPVTPVTIIVIMFVSGTKPLP